MTDSQPNFNAATSPTTKRVNGPISFEADALNLPVEGRLPPGLEGTLYRNGPNPQFPSADQHLFGGDGMLHAFEIRDGRVGYRNRWVRTPRWQAQRDAGRSLVDAFGRAAEGPEGAAVAQLPDWGVGNTHVISHAGRLLALEEAHLPLEIEAHSLATLGPCDLGGKLSGPFTAHPKTDPKSGELLFFGYGTPERLSAGISFGSIAAGGEVTRFERFEAPFSSMVHDFAITEGHLLFPVLPLTGSMARAKAGRPPYAWEPELGSRVGILPRAGGAMRWFEGDPCYVFHLMNAWEERDAAGHLCIVADVMRFDEPPLFPYPDGRPTDPERSLARLCRWRFDLDGGSSRFEQVPLSDRSGEFPRIDDRRAGLPYRHGWYACQREAQVGTGYHGIVHFDAASGRETAWFGDGGDRVSEPVFVPRSTDAPEGDGSLLVVVYRAAEFRSDLLVFEALDLAAGPMATVKLSHRVPSGFHGSWVPAQS